MKIIFPTALSLALCACQPTGNDVAPRGVTQKSEYDGLVHADWSYSEQKDPMSGRTKYFAEALSAEEIHLRSPYDGTQHGHLMIRAIPGHKPELIFSIEKGQLMCTGGASFGTCPVQARLGDDPSFDILGMTPIDNSTEVLFLKSPRITPRVMVEHSKLLIQVSIFQEGTYVFSFNTSDLDLSRLHLDSGSTTASKGKVASHHI